MYSTFLYTTDTGTHFRDSLGYNKINNVDNGNNTGTITVARLDPESEGKDLCIQVLVFKEAV